MSTPLIEDIIELQAIELYQQQLKALYEVINDNHYQQLTVMIDLNIYGTEVLNLLDHGDSLTIERLKRMHHTFNDDLAVIDIPITSIKGQRLLEQLLALAIYENMNDISGHSQGRSVCLWLFDHPITPKFKNDLYLLGQAIDYQTSKRRYLRYWDPRVLSLLAYIWSDQQKLFIHQLGIKEIYYVDWNNELAVLKFQNVHYVSTQEQKVQIKKLIKQPPFRFSLQQWSVLLHIEWANMIIKQLKEQVDINDNIYKLILTQAKAIASQRISQRQAVNNIINSVERMNNHE